MSTSTFISSSEDSAEIDLLSDLLRQAGLRRRVLNLTAFADGNAMRFPCERSIGLHVVLRGPIFLHQEGASAPAPVLLNTGDIALMARGCNHLLNDSPNIDPARVRTMTSEAAGNSRRSARPPESSVRILSGAYQFWNTPVHRFFGELPDWFVVSAKDLPRMSPLSVAVDLLADELQQQVLGGHTVIHGLLDVVFTYLLRVLVQKQGEANAGWSRSVADLQIRRVIEVMHSDVARAWSLESLAREVGISRTSLAERFRESMATTPLSYLRSLRMQNAMRLLSETDQGLERIAALVGYKDAFTFSKVFKRELGLAPREFRARDLNEASTPWRFGP